MNPKLILFSDLDGTILDENYNYLQIKSILNLLQTINVSIILTSSKTRAEVEYYRRKLKLHEPFIVENGSAIILPKGYFKNQKIDSKVNSTPYYNIIELGIDYTTLRSKLRAIEIKTQSTLRGFGDMTINEIAQDSGLPVELANLSKKREYDEPFQIVSGKEQAVLQAIVKEGLSYTKGGRYYHLLGNTDKGKAVAVLKKLYLHEYSKIVTIGVGDGPNDLPMLKVVNKPFFIDNSKNALTVWQKILATAKELSPMP